MKIRFCLFMVCVLHGAQINAGGEFSSAGGRSGGMGNASIALYDGWSGFNNQAGLAWCRRFSAGIGYENRFLVKELGTKAIGAILPVRKGAFGISFSHFGYSLYNEIKAGLAYGMNLGNSFSVGVQVDYLGFHIGNDYGTISLFTCEIGMQYRIKEKLCLGVHVFNPAPIKLVKEPVERLPSVIRLGTAWQVSKNFLLSAELEKDLVNKPVLKAGMEYHFVKPLFIRIGYMTDPPQYTFGFGLEFGKLALDIASSYNTMLGFSPQGSVIYYFK